MKSHIGLDFGLTSIKLVKVNKEKKIKVVIAASASLPTGALFSEVSGDQETVSQAAKKLFEDNQIKERSVVIAVPEFQVFTRVVEIPSLSENEIETALRWQAEQYIPLPLSEVNMDHIVLSKPDGSNGKMKIFLVAVPIHVIERYTKLLNQAGLSPIALETEIIAASRIFARFAKGNSAAMLVDCGATTTNLALLRNQTVIFTHSINIGGDAITRSVAENFKFPKSQAEEYKKAYGIEEQHLQGKIRTVVKPVVDTIVEELKKAQRFYREKYSGQIKTIVLFGGTSLLPGLVPYLAQNLETEVQIGNPWTEFVVESSMEAERERASFYTIATGLALRELI